MIFTKAKFFKLPNDEWSVILYADKKVYGNAIGVRKGVNLDETNKSFIQLGKYVLKNHTRNKNESSSNQSN